MAGGELEVSVTDQGRGIAAADHDGIFDEFTQAPGSGRVRGWDCHRPRAGRRPRGEIDVASAPGAGTTFTLQLPAGSRSCREQARASPRRAQPGAAGESGVPVTVAVAGRRPTGLCGWPSIGAWSCWCQVRRIVSVDVLHAAARSPESELEIVHLTAVGVGARYLEAVGGARPARWAPHEICCLVSRWSAG
jgi:hypothetical protein